MPRQARIDAPGALHHIIARGIERGKIFRDDQDRDFFVTRLGDLIVQTQTKCLAWALIPNHFHLLLKTGLEFTGRGNKAVQMFSALDREIPPGPPDVQKVIQVAGEYGVKFHI